MANEDGIKSAYELALERMEQQGIERPREERLSESVRAAIAEERSKAKAKKAELEIFHRERLTKLLEPMERQREEQEFQAELARIDSGCDRRVEDLRASA